MTTRPYAWAAGAHAALGRREILAWLLAAGLGLLHFSGGAPPCPYAWHGGAPGGAPAGACWVGKSDGYAMCTPSLAIDVVIERGPDAVVLVRRRDNGLYATMGGFVDVGEDLHAAVARELAEETGLALVGAPRLLGVFGDARRDTRRHTVSVVYVAETSGEPRAGDDARAIRTVHVDDLANLDLAFDHRAIIDDYLQWRHKPRRRGETPPADDRAKPIARDVC